MKICVLIKQVPNEDSPVVIGSDGISVNNENTTFTTNESDTYAMEEALLLKEKHGGEVVVCSLGGDSATQVIKDSLAKGGDRGIMINDPHFENLPPLELAKVISEAIKNEAFDLILSGTQSADAGYSQVGVLVAEMLGTTHSALVAETEVVNDSTIKVKRELEGGWFQWSELTLPASLSIQSGINKPRYATLKGIMGVKRKTVDTVTATELGIDSFETTSNVSSLYVPQKSNNTTFIDGTADEIADKLVDLFKNEFNI
jgi:electron transfer flavoprotein beta subunit